jgi:hypothetical protein
VLDQDLIMIPQTGIATITPDEFFMNASLWFEGILTWSD